MARRRPRGFFTDTLPEGIFAVFIYGLLGLLGVLALMALFTGNFLGFLIVVLFIAFLSTPLWWGKSIRLPFVHTEEQCQYCDKVYSQETEGNANRNLCKKCGDFMFVKPSNIWKDLQHARRSDEITAEEYKKIRDNIFTEIHQNEERRRKIHIQELKSIVDSKEIKKMTYGKDMNTDKKYQKIKIICGKCKEEFDLKIKTEDLIGNTTKRLCPSCGSELQIRASYKKCKNCGSELLPKDKYCPGCGKKC